MKILDDKYIQVKKIDMDLSDKQALKKTLSQYKLRNEVWVAIEKKSDNAISANGVNIR